MMRFLTAILLMVCPFTALHPARASADGSLCEAAAAAAELATGVPNQLLDAISRVETGRYDAAAGGIRAWPWTINAEGHGHFYASKADALAAAQAFQAAGIRSIDVGCMQINLMYHPDGFASLEEAFDPHANAAFAARFLTDLFHQTGSWPHAAAAYHSQTPDLGIDYQNKVLEAWAEPTDRPDAGSSPGARREAVDAPHPAYASSSQDPGNPSPFGPRPLGGIGSIVRTPYAAPRGAMAGGTGRDLAAYRAMPVRVAYLPPSGLRLR